MKLTLKKLEKFDACIEGVEWYKDQGIEDFQEICNRLLKSDYVKDYLIWILPRMMNKKQRVKWAVFCAELVIDNFEKEFPNDDRPRKAIEAAKRYAKHQTQRNKDAAWSAGPAAESAARSAARSAWSAWSAGPAAESAARSAWSAWTAWSARSAAESAVWSARSAGSTEKDTLIKCAHNGMIILGLEVKK